MQLAKGQWLIIPKPGAGGTGIDGQNYNLTANISYTVDGVNFEVTTQNVTIIVKPQSLVALDYYIPSEVIANQPFKLAVKVINVGYGTARNFSIDTAQPLIYDNPSHLLVDFKILRSALQGENRSNSLKINFGDIKPGESKLAWWEMVTGIDGTFTEFTGEYTHSSELGGMETSLINQLNTNIIHKEINTGNITYDFLVTPKDNEKYYLLLDPNNGKSTPVSIANYTIVSGPTIENPNLNISIEDLTGKWVIVSIEDPYNNKVPILKITRNRDGSEIAPYNYWMRNGKILIVDRYIEGFDGKYTILYCYNKFTFVQLTDVHIGPDPILCGFDLSLLDRTLTPIQMVACQISRKDSSNYFINVINNILSLSPRPEVVLITGDLIQWNSVEQYRDFKQVVSKLANEGIKIKIVPGNHDRRGEDYPTIDYPIPNPILPVNDLTNYKKNINDQTFIGTDRLEYIKNIDFSYRGYNFIGIDSGSDYDANDIDLTKCLSLWDCTPESSGLDYEHQILPIPQNKDPKIVFMHNPAIDTENDKNLINSAPGGNDNSIALNRLEFIQSVNEKNVRLVLTGHSHIAKFLTNQGTNVPNFARDIVRPLFVQTRSATQGSPTGYLIIDLDKNGDHIQDKIIKNPSFLDYIEAIVKSPADLNVYDEFGRHTGLNVSGGVETNIPDSYYFEEYKIGNITLPAFVLLYNTTLKYRFEIVSNFSKENITTDQSSFNFSLKHKTNNSTTTINFNNVSININSIAYLKINTSEINYTMQIDKNNDSLIDTTNIPDSMETDNAPTAIIISPANGSIWDQEQPITFNGAGLDREDGTLTKLIWISDRDGVIGQGNFSSVNLSAGVHNITLVVNDTIGQFNASNMVIIVRDTKPPVLNIDYPPENKIYNKQNITLKGIAYDDSGILDVTVNGIQAGKENWNTNLELNEGKNIIEVVATDIKGFSTKVNRSVYYNSSLASDTQPPAAIINLIHKTGYNELDRAWINWTWDNPKDADFSYVSIYLDNILMENTSMSYYNITGLSSDANYTIRILTSDVVDNINYTEINETVKTAGYNPPPATITNLSSMVGSTWLNWTWDNPSDSDFSHVMLYLNGSFKTSIPAPQNYYNFTGLEPDTPYELGTHTVDTSGNINETWKNVTARTLSLPDTTPPTITFVLPTPDNNSEISVNYVNISINLSELGAAHLFWNGAQEGMEGSDIGFFKNKTGLDNGVYFYYVIASDAADNVNTSETRWVTVNIPAPVFNISGFKINDTNGNGLWDAGEQGIANWNISLKNATTEEEIASTSTNVDGFYQFINHANGRFNVTEEMKSGWTPTNATFKVINIAGLDIANLNFTNKNEIPTTNITIISPNGGENWQSGIKQVICWTYSGDPRSRVKIELLKGDVVNHIITSRTQIGRSGSGSYNWRIPSTQAPGTDYKIRVTSTSSPVDNDISNNNFTIS